MVRKKVLWVFGFFLTNMGMSNFLFRGGGTPPPMDEGFGEIPPSLPFDPFTGTPFGKLIEIISQDSRLMIFLIASAVLFWLIFMFLALVSEGSLVYGVWQNEEQAELRLRNLFSKGLGLFARMFAINITIWLPVIFLWLLFLISIGFGIFGILTAGGRAVAFGLIVFLMFIVMILVTITASITNNLTKRFAVIESLKTFSSIGHAVKLMFGQTGNVIKLYFASLGLYILIAIGLGTVFLMVNLPVGLIGRDLSLRKLLALLFLLVPVMFVLRLVGGIATVFMSSIWTIGFLSLRNIDMSKEQAGGTDDAGIGAQ